MDKISDTFFDLLEKREDFIINYTPDQRNEVCKELDLLLCVENPLHPRIVELSAVLYKWMSKEWQKIIFDGVTRSFKGEDISEVIAICNFCWINGKVFSALQLSAVKSLLENINALHELSDTIQHTLNSYDYNYVPRYSVCLFIPEFLSGMSFLQPPLGMMTISSLLKQSQINSDLLDNRAFHYSFENVISIIKDYKVLVVNTTPIDQVQNYFLDYRHSITVQLLKQIRNTYPDLIIVLCGSHGTVRPDIVESYDVADYIICGEYEEAVASLITKINNEKSERPIHPIKIDIDKRPALQENVFPDYNAINIAQYYGNVHFRNINVKKRNWSIIQTSRGCPYHCSFCYNFYGHEMRRYTVEHVIKELQIMKQYGIESFFIIDQLFTENKEFVVNLCQNIISLPFHFEWTCQTRIDCLDDEMLQYMKKAGCKGIWLGVESVNDDVLKLNHKGTTRKQIEDSIQLLRSNSIKYEVFFMLGMMGETKESLKEIKSFIIENDLPCTKSFMICAPRYGTEMGRIAEAQYNIVDNSFGILNKYRGLVNNNITFNDINETIKELNEFFT